MRTASRMATSPKNQRLVLAIVAVVVLVAAGLLAAWALRNQASYFYLPSQLLAEQPSADRPIRLGGMVADGSLQTMPDGVTVRFAVTDNERGRVNVQYAGLLPDLFVEGSGVVAEGRYRGGGEFEATTLLAKHDENYVPRELEGMTVAQEAAYVSDTLEPEPASERDSR